MYSTLGHTYVYKRGYSMFDSLWHPSKYVTDPIKLAHMAFIAALLKLNQKVGKQAKLA